jgi:DNA-binding FadR family transcriptional regulator
MAPPSVDRERELFLQPISSRNPFEESFAQLLRTIRVGGVLVGETLPAERELAESLGVSRTTVREAIRALEHAGYVTTRRGRFGGTLVVRDQIEPTAKERNRLFGPALQEALDVRRAVEPGAAALAAVRAAPDQIAEMRRLLETVRHSGDTEYLRANCQLHVAVGRASGSERLTTLITDVELQIMDVLATVPRLERSVEHSDEQHEAIVNAIADASADAARASMEDHVTGSDVILRELKLKPGRRPKRR